MAITGLRGVTLRLVLNKQTNKPILMVASGGNFPQSMNTAYVLLYHILTRVPSKRYVDNTLDVSIPGGTNISIHVFTYHNQRTWIILSVSLTT